MNPVIIQVIGYVALLFVVLSPQFNKRGTILLSLIIGVLLFVLHYSLLHAWTGAAMNAIEAIVVYVSYQKDTKTWAKHTYWLYTFILLFFLIGILTGVNTINLLPIVAQIIATIAVWQKKPRLIRLISLPPRPLWFLYNFMVGSYPGMIAEVFILISILTGIIRFDSKKFLNLRKKF